MDVATPPPLPQLYLHNVVVQAERDFARLFPGEPFWPPPAGQGEDGDDQAEMLEAAASAVTTSGVDADKEGGGGGEQGEEGGRGAGEQKVEGGGDAGKQEEEGGGYADREEPGGEHGQEVVAGAMGGGQDLGGRHREELGGEHSNGVEGSSQQAQTEGGGTKAG